MKWLVRNDMNIVLMEFNSKKEAERYIIACKERNAKGNYSIIFRAGNQLW